MESWKKQIPLWDRLQFAWKAFRLQRYSKTYPIAVRCGDLIQDYVPCDIGGIGRQQGCTEDARHCLSRPTIIVGILTDEHVHVCEKHAHDIRWIEKGPSKPIVEPEIRNT